MQGSIPDMFATTAMYLQLQRVYRERAEQDVAAVEAHLARILQSVGRDAKSVPKADIRAFCKNARNLRCSESASDRPRYTYVDKLTYRAVHTGIFAAVIHYNSSTDKARDIRRTSCIVTYTCQSIV